MLSILGKRNLMAGTDGFIYITLNTSYDLPLPIKKSKKQVCSFSNNAQQPISKYWNRFWPSITIALLSTEPPSSLTWTVTVTSEQVSLLPPLPISTVCSQHSSQILSKCQSNDVILLLLWTGSSSHSVKLEVITLNYKAPDNMASFTSSISFLLLSSLWILFQPHNLVINPRPCQPCSYFRVFVFALLAPGMLLSHIFMHMAHPNVL